MSQLRSFLRTLPRLAGTVLFALSLHATALQAQQPSEEDIRNALATNPDAADQVRSKIRQSGMNQDQIRARLQQAGYSSNLLDPFLQEGQPGDSTQPDANQLAAITALGLAPAAANRPIMGQRTPGVTSGLTGAGARPRSRVFGVDVFLRTSTQFFPLFNGPVPADYLLGPGDVPVIILTGDVEQTEPIPITRDGFVLIPRVGQVYLANLTVEQAKQALTTRLRRVYSGVGTGPTASTRFDLTVSNVRAVTVYVIGEAMQPGAYQISGMGTVLTGVYAAGGVTERANMRAVEVRRQGRVIGTFDLYDYLLRGDTKNDIRLTDGDVVNIPLRSERAAISGAVVRPAVYDLRPEETLADLLVISGGFGPEAVRTSINIHRIVPASQRTPGQAPRQVLLASIPDGTSIPAIPLVDGDSIVVSTLDGAVDNQATIAGNVFQQGKYGILPGVTRLSDLVAKAGGLRPGSFRGRGHLVRMGRTDQLSTQLTFTLPADSASPWQDDPVLQSADSVMIYGLEEMREAMTVTINGQVTRAALFPWHRGLTLRDLVLQARGLRAGAMLTGVEIARLPVDRRQGALATILRVDLDSTYLFDRDSAGRVPGPRGVGFASRGAPEILLEPFDNVTIFPQPGFEMQRTIRIYGAVNLPGTYSLQSRTERLSDVIQRANGLTRDAYPEGIRFYRMYPRRIAVGGAVVDTVIPGRINIDLPKALRKKDSRDNLSMQPGDSIYIPEFEPTVTVEGAVNQPGPVLYRAGADMSYYIGAAGGLAQNALASRANVQQPDGEVETKGGRFLLVFGPGDPEPRPGATIRVPMKVERPNDGSSIALLGGLASILASTVAIVAVVIRN